MSTTILPYQEKFIDFLLDSSALLFGEFQTKSGRKSPYFINTGKFNSGSKLRKLGAFYASHIVENKLSRASVIFGPAYKGIPLCTTTAIALDELFSIECGYTFDRKEAKDHGDGGMLVGAAIPPGTTVVLVEDVVTAGTTLRKMVPFLKQELKAELLGVVISVDRCERGEGSLSAVQEAETTLGVKVFPIVTIHTILGYLSNHKDPARRLSTLAIENINRYLEQYGT